MRERRGYVTEDRPYYENRALIAEDKLPGLFFDPVAYHGSVALLDAQKSERIARNSVIEAARTEESRLQGHAPPYPLRSAGMEEAWYWRERCRLAEDALWNVQRRRR